MEIGFYFNKRENEGNKCKRYDLNLVHFECESDALPSMAIGDLQISHSYLTQYCNFHCSSLPKQSYN